MSKTRPGLGGKVVVDLETFGELIRQMAEIVKELSALKGAVVMKRGETIQSRILEAMQTRNGERMRVEEIIERVRGTYTLGQPPESIEQTVRNVLARKSKEPDSPLVRVRRGEYKLVEA